MMSRGVYIVGPAGQSSTLGCRAFSCKDKQLEKKKEKKKEREKM